MITQGKKPDDLRLWQRHSQNLTAEESCTCRSKPGEPCPALTHLPPYAEAKYTRRMRRAMKAAERRRK